MDKRSAIFLDEMGIGVQWQLRQRPAAPASEVEAEMSAVLPEMEAGAAPLAMPEVVVEPVAEAPVAPPVPPAPPAPPAPLAQVVAPVVPTVSALAPQPASAPVPIPAPVAASSKAADGEDMSWFDDVPAPVRAPTLKGTSPAAPVPASAAAFAAAPETVAAAPLSDEAIAALDWPALQNAISHCTRCTLCHSRQQPALGRGSHTAATIALVAAASAKDEQAAELVAGDAGQLLGNMLGAIELDMSADVYLTALVKCRPVNEQGQERAPNAQELQACRPYLERELALTGATLAITFGQHAARGLMLGAAARGAVMSYGASGLPVVATYHPNDLLQRPQDKAKAWADLCLARSVRD